MERLRPVARRDARPHRRVRVHPFRGGRAGEQLQEDFEVLPARHQLLDAHDRDQRVGQGQAHPAVALGLDDHHGAGLGDREVRAGDRDAGPEELLAEVEAGGLGECPRVVGQVVRRGPAGGGHLADEDVADLGPVAVDRRDEDVRRQVAPELDDQLREVGLPGSDPLARQRLVQLDLLGHHRFDLDDLAGAGRPDDVHDRRVRLGCVASPVDDAARGLNVRFELQQQLREAREDVVLDRGTGESELLPVVELRDGPRPLVADRRRRAAEVRPELAVGKRGASGLRERRRPRE